MASTSPVEEMIDQEDWSHISEPALRKRIQNRNSQRKLRAKRKLQNQPISFDIMTSTSALEIDLDSSGAPVADDFLFDGLIDPLNPLSPSLDLDLMTPPLDLHSSSTLDLSALDTPSWTEAPDHEYLAVGSGGIDEGALILDPALVSDVSGPGPGVDMSIVGASTQSSNDIHIYIHHDCPTPLLPNTANQQPLPSSLGPSAARRSRWSTRIFHLHSNNTNTNTNTNTNNTGRGESRCESSCSAARKKRRAAPAPPPPRPTAHFPGTCQNCGSPTGPGQPDSPYPSSHSHIAQVARILSHSHPALAEMLMQPNAHIEYKYPDSSSSSSSSSSSPSSSSSSSSSLSAITPLDYEMQEGGDAEAEVKAEASDVRPLHIVINLSPSPAAYSG